MDVIEALVFGWIVGVVTGGIIYEIMIAWKLKRGLKVRLWEKWPYIAEFYKDGYVWRWGKWIKEEIE